MNLVHAVPRPFITTHCQRTSAARRTLPNVNTSSYQFAPVKTSISDQCEQAIEAVKAAKP
eukprot:1859577-Prymnesium_polylepis.1